MKEWVIPKASAEFVCQMEEVLDIYALPYDEKRPVVCFDESPKQLLSERRAAYINAKGEKREDCEYQREGATEIFMIVNPLAGHREIIVNDDHTGVTWAKTMAYIVEEMYPNAEKVTIIQDNLSTHRKGNMYNVFGAKRAREIIKKIEFIYTPKHGSWLNIAECELSVLSKQALNRRFATKEEVINQVKAWQKDRNNKQKGVDWQFTTNDARVKLKKLYPTIIT